MTDYEILVHILQVKHFFRLSSYMGQLLGMAELASDTITEDSVVSFWMCMHQFSHKVGNSSAVKHFCKLIILEVAARTGRIQVSNIIKEDSVEFL